MAEKLHARAQRPAIRLDQDWEVFVRPTDPLLPDQAVQWPQIEFNETRRVKYNLRAGGPELTVPKGFATIGYTPDRNGALVGFSPNGSHIRVRAQELNQVVSRIVTTNSEWDVLFFSFDMTGDGDDILTTYFLPAATASGTRMLSRTTANEQNSSVWEIEFNSTHRIKQSVLCRSYPPIDVTAKGWES